jgi:hypothetical protein
MVAKPLFRQSPLQISTGSSVAEVRRLIMAVFILIVHRQSQIKIVSLAHCRTHPLILPEANKEIAASDPVCPTSSLIRSGSSSPTSSEDFPTQTPSSSTAVKDLGPTQYQRRFRTEPAFPEAFSWADDAIEDARRRTIGVGDINAYNSSSRTFMNGAAGWGFRAH